jgi:hypothetical protein
VAILPLRSLEAIVPKGNGPLGGVAVLWQMSGYATKASLRRLA